jgi:hypothetical protein
VRVHPDPSSFYFYLRGIFWIFSSIVPVRFSTLLHLPPFRSTVSVDAVIEPRTFATLALTARRSKHSVRSHSHSARTHPHSARSSVPDPDPPDPRVFWAPGSGSISQRYGSGSGSFYLHAKIMRRILNPTIF